MIIIKIKNYELWMIFFSCFFAFTQIQRSWKPSRKKKSVLFTHRHTWFHSQLKNAHIFFICTPTFLWNWFWNGTHSAYVQRVNLKSMWSEYIWKFSANIQCMCMIKLNIFGPNTKLAISIEYKWAYSVNVLRVCMVKLNCFATNIYSVFVKRVCVAQVRS